MKILVVDDVLIERINVANIVRQMGHEPIEAANGVEALELVLKHKPAAVVMDIVMPVMDGFAALKRMTMNPATKSIPVIIVSSKGQESDRVRGKMLGAKGWLQKPVTAPLLSDALKGLI